MPNSLKEGDTDMGAITTNQCEMGTVTQQTWERTSILPMRDKFPSLSNTGIEHYLF